MKFTRRHFILISLVLILLLLIFQRFQLRADEVVYPQESDGWQITSSFNLGTCKSPPINYENPIPKSVNCEHEDTENYYKCIFQLSATHFTHVPALGYTPTCWKKAKFIPTPFPWPVEPPPTSASPAPVAQSSPQPSASLSPSPSPSPCPSPKPVAGAKIAIIQDQQSKKKCRGEQLSNELSKSFPFNLLSVEVVNDTSGFVNCFTDSDGLIDCNETAALSLTNAPIVMFVTSQSNGRANAKGQTIFMSEFDSVNVAKHELGHVAGLKDEYKPDSGSEQSFYCYNDTREAPNVKFFPVRDAYTESQARDILTGIPWGKFIGPNIPLTKNGKLGTPGNNPALVGLFYNDRCDPILGGVMPHANSFMRNSNSLIPPYHMYELVKSINAITGAGLAVPEPSNNQTDFELCPTPKPTKTPGSTQNSSSPTPKTTEAPCEAISPSPKPTS